MERKKTWMVVGLVLCVTFFEYGCTAAQRKELLMEGLEATKEYVTENVIPKIGEIAENKIKEQEQKQLAILDQQLAAFKVVDVETGIEIVKTWKDFDINKDGSLDTGEIAKVTGFISVQIAKKVATGEMSKEEAGRLAKGTGTTLTALLLLLLGKRGVDKFAKKTPPKTTTASPPA